MPAIATAASATSPRLALFYSNNDNSAPVAPDGLVTAANRGEAFILARFDTKTVGSQAIVLPAGLKYSPPAVPPANYIDELVNAKLQKLRILPSDLCSDRGLPAAGDDRHHRRAADRGRISGLPRRQVARQAGEARRSPPGAQGLCRNLGHEVGRAAHGPLGRADAGQLQVDLSLFQLAYRADRRQRAAGPDRAATAGRPRRHVLVAGRRTSTRSSATR